MDKKRKKIVVVGMGYVGLSNALLLSKNNAVIGIDISVEKIQMLNDKISPIDENDISSLLKQTSAEFKTTKYLENSLNDADYVVICTPTNFETETGKFDTLSIHNVLKTVEQHSPAVNAVIRSTIPMGFIDECRKKFQISEIFFVPEFLREGYSIKDNIYPSRIVVGSKTEAGGSFAKLMLEYSERQNTSVHYMEAKEAESVKLFSNSYLAARVAFFNELDTFAHSKSLNADTIISAMCDDPRIGSGYNNPSFGYGGYCLPKDVQQLSQTLKTAPLIQSIHKSNLLRKKYIISEILKLECQNIGINRLSMKAGSDNIRESSILDIIEELHQQGRNILIYEPDINWQTTLPYKSAQSQDILYKESDIVLANRAGSIPQQFIEKTFTRDVYGET